ARGAAAARVRARAASPRRRRAAVTTPAPARRHRRRRRGMLRAPRSPPVPGSRRAWSRSFPHPRPRRVQPSAATPSQGGSVPFPLSSLGWFPQGRRAEGGGRRLLAMRSRTLLGLWAHPDDEAYLSAGLMYHFVRRGDRVVVVTATAGERGTADPRTWP